MTIAPKRTISQHAWRSVTEQHGNSPSRSSESSSCHSYATAIQLLPTNPFLNPRLPEELNMQRNSRLFDLGDFWSFSRKFRGRNSLVGKFSGFFYLGFFRGSFYFILKSQISSNHRNYLIWNKPSDWLYFLDEYQRSISLVYCTNV